MLTLLARYEHGTQPDSVIMNDAPRYQPINH